MSSINLSLFSVFTDVRGLENLYFVGRTSSFEHGLLVNDSFEIPD